MKQIHFIIEAVLAIAIIVLFFMMPRSSASKSAINPRAEQAAATLPIAYVRMDSLASQYEYNRDLNRDLAAEAEQSRRTLATKLSAMQKAAEDFQRRLRTNAFVSEDAARAEQEKIMKMQEEGQKLELSMSQTLANKQAEANEKMYQIVREQIAKMKEAQKRMLVTWAVTLVVTALMLAIDAKFWGVVVMGGAVIILFFLPWLDYSPVKSIRYRPDWHKYFYAVFVINFLILGYLGVQPPSPIGERVSQVGTLFYFGFFLLMPWWSRIGKTKPVPDRVTYVAH